MTRRPLADLVDALVLLAAVLLVLSMLDDTFSDRTHYWLGALPVVLLLGLALSLRGRTNGGWVFGIVALLLYAPLGALAALRAPGPYVVPAADDLGRMLAATVTGPLELVSTLPPVEPTGIVLAVPFLLGYLMGGAAWAAVASSRPLLPTLPVLLGLGLCIPLSTLVPDHLVTRGAVLAALLLWWVALRARRTQRVVGAARGRATQPLVAALMVGVVSVVAVVLVPDRSEVDRVLLRGRFGTALETGELSDPMGVGRPRGGPRPALLLQTSGVPAGRSLRFATLDEYDGTTWVPAEQSPGAGAAGGFQRIGEQVTPLHDGTAVAVRVQVRPAYVSDWLPTLGELTGIELDYTDGRTQLSQVRYNQATSSALVIGGVDPRDDYTFTAVTTPTRLPRRAVPMEPVPEQRQPAGTFLDRYLRNWTGTREAPIDRLDSFMAFLARNGSTRLTGSESDLGPRALGRGILGSDRVVATPHQYAALVALAACRFGVPARLVVGAEPDRRGRVLADEVSSWVEVQVEDGTWREVDPLRYLGGQRLTGVPGEGGAGASGVGAGGTRDGEDVKLPKGTKVDLPEGTEIPGERDLRPLLVALLLGLLVALVLLWLLVPVAKLLRRRARAGRRSWSSRYVGQWQELVDTARDAGRPVGDHLGRVPQARALGRAAEVARAADAAVFAPVAPGRAAERQFRRDVRAEEEALVHSLSRRRRVWRWFNPASLVAGWARHRAEAAAVSAGRRRGSRSPASGSRGGGTSRPTPGRAREATRARAGRPG